MTTRPTCSAPTWAGASLPTRSRCSASRAPHAPDLQLVVGDGLSATAVHAQLPVLLPALIEQARGRGWTVGRTVVVEFARVGILNDIGATLGARVVALLIGERPGLNTAESLSAYLAWRPAPGDTDAKRNLVSNIHADGLPAERAAAEIIALAGRMMAAGVSGVALGSAPPIATRAGGTVLDSTRDPGDSGASGGQVASTPAAR